MASPPRLSTSAKEKTKTVQRSAVAQVNAHLASSTSTRRSPQRKSRINYPASVTGAKKSGVQYPLGAASPGSGANIGTEYEDGTPAQQTRSHSPSPPRRLASPPRRLPSPPR